MPLHTIPSNALSGQNLATPFQIQQNIVSIRRQLANLDAAQRDEYCRLHTDLLAERQRYADALGAERLREQGKAAVEAAMIVWGLA